MHTKLVPLKVPSLKFYPGYSYLKKYHKIPYRKNSLCIFKYYLYKTELWDYLIFLRKKLIQ